MLLFGTTKLFDKDLDLVEKRGKDIQKLEQIIQKGSKTILSVCLFEGNYARTVSWLEEKITTGRHPFMGRI